MDMKTVIVVLSSAILLFAFGDRTQNSFSQQAPKPASAKTKVNIDSIRLATVNDSLRLELEKTKVIVENTKKIAEESEQLTQEMLINKEKHIAVKNLAVQTLKIAVFKSERMPMHFQVHPIKNEPSVVPIIVTPLKDSTIVKKKKRFRWPWK